MPTKAEVEALLEKLEDGPADDLEGQTLDFMEWSEERGANPKRVLIEKIVCMANGGGGTIVVGVRDRVKTRRRAILGVPLAIDMAGLRRSVQDSTRPRVTATFERLTVPEGYKRLFVVQVIGGMPPYTDASGTAKIREGKDCVPFDGSMQRDRLAASGATDSTASAIAGSISDLVSESGVDRLREIAREQGALPELLRRPTPDFLQALGVLNERGDLRRAGLLLVGRKEKIAEHFPGFRWAYLRMDRAGDYSDRAAGEDCLAVAIETVERRISANNPLITIERELLHLEHRTYPVVAIREGLLNAFGHADYSIPGTIQVKQFHDRLEISNPGGFIGGVNPGNILNHAPVPRNPALVAALDRLNLVNRSNLGVRRIFRAMLSEGKEPPLLRDVGNSVQLILRAGDLSAPFHSFVREEAARDRFLEAEHLLLIRYLLREDEIRAAKAAQVMQRDESGARDCIRQLEAWGILQQAGKGSRALWRLRLDVMQKLAGDALSVIDAAQVRVLDALKSNKDGLSASEIREITGLNEQQAKYLMQKMRGENLAKPGRGRASKWTYVAPARKRVGKR